MKNLKSLRLIVLTEASREIHTVGPVRKDVPESTIAAQEHVHGTYFHDQHISIQKGFKHHQSML